MVLLILRNFLRGLNVKEKLSKASEDVAPFVSAATILMTLSYIISLNPGEQVNHGILSSAPARTLSAIGKLLGDLVFPLVSLLTAFAIGGKDAVTSGLFGGALIISGYSFLSPEGSITSLSGIFGAVNTGLIAGWWIILIKKFTKEKLKIKSEALTKLLVEVSGIIITALASLLINTVALKSGDYTALLLAFSKSKGDFYPFLLLPFFVNFNPGGATYLASFTFSCAMLRSADARLHASVFVSTMVPVISAALYHIIFQRKEYPGRYFSLSTGLLCSFSGVHIAPLVMYITNPFRSILSFTSGSLLSSVLCYFFSCKVGAYEGGFLAFELMDKPLTLISVILCGGLLGTLVLYLTENQEKEVQ